MWGLVLHRPLAQSLLRPCEYPRRSSEDAEAWRGSQDLQLAGGKIRGSPRKPGPDAGWDWGTLAGDGGRLPGPSGRLLLPARGLAGLRKQEGRCNSVPLGDAVWRKLFRGRPHLLSKTPGHPCGLCSWRDPCLGVAPTPQRPGQLGLRTGCCGLTASVPHPDPPAGTSLGS